MRFEHVLGALAMTQARSAGRAARTRTRAGSQRANRSIRPRSANTGRSYPEGGIRRRRAGKGFVYVDAHGSRITAEADLDRIRRLAIPPAWTQVVIASSPRARIQATGIDNRGRKQYRYRATWRARRDRTKFERLIAFGSALPRIRERVAADLALPGLPREKVLAVVVRLLDETLIRIGNDAYARDNGSFGLTTLRDEHAAIASASVTFTFRGKSGREHQIRLRDRRLSRIVARCRDVPGAPLFQYRDGDGAVHRIRSVDVNRYLQEAAGEHCSAKDFRTWSGTLACARYLWSQPAPEGERAKKALISRAVAEAARALGNTAAVCRSSYVHPGIFAAYAAGGLGQPGRSYGDEQALLALLAEWPA